MSEDIEQLKMQAMEEILQNNIKQNLEENIFTLTQEKRKSTPVSKGHIFDVSLTNNKIIGGIKKALTAKLY